MITGRRVEVSIRTNKYEGVLVAFGVGYEELRDGIAQYTEAVIMRDDGNIDVRLVDCLRVQDVTGLLGVKPLEGT